MLSDPSFAPSSPTGELRSAVHDKSASGSSVRATETLPSPMLAARARGFTLLELMATIAIIAILASIALPNYVDYVRRSRLTDAFQTMTQFRTRMEQAFQDNGNYGVAGGPCAAATPAASAYFTYGCTLGGTGASFAMSATGVGFMSGYAYTVDDAGNQRTTAFPGATVPIACWLNRRGDC